MKSSPTMQAVVEQLVAHHRVDLSQVGAFVRLDRPGRDSLLIDHSGSGQIAVVDCFEECGAWKIDREVIFFTGERCGWVPFEITQLATGWTALARLDVERQCIVRINHCGQERLAEFAEQWAYKLIRQNWLEESTPYTLWTPPGRQEIR